MTVKYLPFLISEFSLSTFTLPNLHYLFLDYGLSNYDDSDEWLERLLEEREAEELQKTNFKKGKHTHAYYNGKEVVATEA